MNDILSFYPKKRAILLASIVVYIVLASTFFVLIFFILTDDTSGQLFFLAIAVICYLIAYRSYRKYHFNIVKIYSIKITSRKLLSFISIDFIQIEEDFKFFVYLNKTNVVIGIRDIKLTLKDGKKKLIPLNSFSLEKSNKILELLKLRLTEYQIN